MSPKFIHLRLHSAYSLAEGAIPVKKIPGICQRHNMPAVAITDTNAFFGAPQFSALCRKNGIQPIIGATFAFNQHDNVDAKTLRAGQLSEIALLAQSEAGFQNMSKLITNAYLREDNGHLGAYITFAELAEASEGIICLSGGTKGPITAALIEKQDNLADEFAMRFAKIFPTRFYMEIQRHGLESEIKTEPALLDIAYKNNIPIVATNNIFFETPDAFEAFDALLCIAGGTQVVDPNRRRETPEHYWKSADEMCALFSDLPEALENSVNIARRCAFVIPTRPPLLPRFADNFDEECKMLRDRTFAGLAKRLDDLDIVDEAVRKTYFDQAEFELSVIIRMKFPGYFLIVADYVEWCKNNEVMVGPGRGSGAGSVVSWACGITSVNPFKYGLLFERFLNPDRISMPDFDIDFEPDGIERVIEYIQQKYRYDHVSRIITFGSLKAKGTLRDVARVMGVSYAKADRMAKLIDVMEKDSLTEIIAKTPQIRDLLAASPELAKVADIAIQLEGLYRHAGVHAAGVIVGDRPLVELAPLYKDPANGIPATQYDMKYVEDVGLIKFDFLGLATLTILKYTAELIKKNHSVDVAIDKIPLDDPRVFKLLQDGKTAGVFQVESQGMRNILRQIRPTLFDEIVAIVALYRPGPMAQIPEFVERKHGRSPILYPHPKAEEFLKETYGILVYQEQVMEASKKLAGFTPGEADTLRKGMGKKLRDVIDSMRPKFIKGCAEVSGMSEDDSTNLWNLFVRFAEYAFNKSHSVCYAVITNQCAYLKAHYPAEFIAASMSHNLNNSDKLAAFVDDATTNFGLKIISPDVNESAVLFTTKGKGIVFGLAAMKGVGESAAQAIIRARESGGAFKNITDFAKRCTGLLNKRILEAFIKAGAFDCIEKNRAKLFMNMDRISEYGAKSKAAGISLFESADSDDVAENRLDKQMDDAAPWTFGEKLAGEYDMLGFYISAHPLDQHKKIFEKNGMVKSSTQIQAMGDRESVLLPMFVESAKLRTTKMGKPMLVVKGSDLDGVVEAVSFANDMDRIFSILDNNKLVMLAARTSVRDDRVSIMIDRAIPLMDWVANEVSMATIDVYEEESLKTLNAVLTKLATGQTKIRINVHSNGKITTLTLPQKYKLTAQALETFTNLSPKIEYS
ncbi:MAG: DNA polymerase III subunit alpha [Rickettsiales bacterium]|jgi:DNA polymerase-3 subunit alpha|nr:DNA polymerase III subunit alpha [Rickettsiales bacterium]